MILLAAALILCVISACVMISGHRCFHSTRAIKMTDGTSGPPSYGYDNAGRQTKVTYDKFGGTGS